MIVLTVGLSCDGDAAGLCRVILDPAASRGVPVLSSAPVGASASTHRRKNALRDERTGGTGRR